MDIPQITLHVFVCDAENYMEQSFGIALVENLPVSAYPLNLGGDRSPPKFWRWPSTKHCKTRGFGHSTP